MRRREAHGHHRHPGEPARQDFAARLELGERGPLVALVGLRFLAGAEVDRRRRRAPRSAPRRSTPASARRATHAAVAQRDHERVRRRRAAPRAKIGELDLGAPADERLDVALRLLERRVGREAVIEVELEAVGHDVAAAAALAPASAWSRCGREAVDARCSRGASAPSSARSAPALWIAFSPCQGRALCAVRPSNVTVACIEPAAAELQLVVATARGRPRDRRCASSRVLRRAPGRARSRRTGPSSRA